MGGCGITDHEGIGESSYLTAIEIYHFIMIDETF